MAVSTPLGTARRKWLLSTLLVWVLRIEKIDGASPIEEG
jgi:hypothetical protein